MHTDDVKWRRSSFQAIQGGGDWESSVDNRV